jgi:elongation factor G
VLIKVVQDVITGDTVTSGLTARNSSIRWLAKKQGIPESEAVLALAGVQVPDPVFFCSIEPSSLVGFYLNLEDLAILRFLSLQKYQKPLEQALDVIQKEDPSLKVNLDAETGQLIIGGMGELHLEIVLERIRSDFGVDASLGPFQVAYRETIVSGINETFILEKTLGLRILKVHPCVCLTVIILDFFMRLVIS